ncbi:MAG: hypothetical protein JWP12_1420 [Bacteroidetes bacterium]|nr:hypothetical protein [Bacteroidota bacterium]
MKAKLFITLPVIFCSSFAFAQDTIYKTDGNAILVKVLEVGPASVKFRFVDASSVLTIPKKEIIAIGYQGGGRELYGIAPPKRQQAEIPAEIEAPRVMLKNIIALNCFDVAFANLSVSYERILNSGKISFKIPLSIGLDGRPNTTQYSTNFGNTMFLQNRIYSGGLELNVYPFGQTRSTFYVGISGQVGQFHYYRDIHDSLASSGYGYYPVTGHEKFIGTHYSGMVHIGGYIGVSENFLIGAKLAIGYKKEETVFEDYTQFRAQLDLNLAYRF